MNGRILSAPTPSKRIAALFRSILIRYNVPVPNLPDYADFETLIEPFIEHEMLLARKEEGTKTQSMLRREMLEDELGRTLRDMQKMIEKLDL